MASISQINANRRNAKHSTGPKSALGKHTVSQNSRQHGLTGKVQPGSDEHAEVLRRTDQLMEMFGLHRVSRPAAMALAAAQVRLESIRTTRASALAATIGSPSPVLDRSPDDKRHAQATPHLLARLDRYERMAQADRDRALQELLMSSSLETANVTTDDGSIGRGLEGASVE